MTLTHQFRALLKLAGLWAVPWTALGVVVAVARWVTTPDLASSGQSLGSWLLSHALGYGALGLISGLYLGLLLAQLERGRRAEQVPLRRIALWSGLAGAAPPVLFAGLGLVFGAPPLVYLPLVGLGVVSAVVSGTLATSTLAAMRRQALPPANEHPRVRAT
jgi:hypothetical protein